MKQSNYASMYTTTPNQLRIGSDLTSVEKREIIEAMFAA